jgi:hypothetical protein
MNMPTQQRPRGIINGHWEPTIHEPPKVVQLVRTGVAKLLKKISPHAHDHDSSSRKHERHEPMAAE